MEDTNSMVDTNNNTEVDMVDMFNHNMEVDMVDMFNHNMEVDMVVDMFNHNMVDMFNKVDITTDQYMEATALTNCMEDKDMEEVLRVH
jgi:hypothetical protein